MNIVKFILVVVAISMLGACATVSGMLGRDSGFRELDINGDGVLSEREAQELPTLANSFDRADTNQDRNVNANEFRAANTMVASLEFSRLDMNGDGVISEREAQASRPSLKQSFGRVDADEDGNVSKVEYQAATHNLLREVPFEDLDRDGDGVLSDDEAARNPVLNTRFDAIDINGDGLVSPDEYEAAQRI